MGRVLICGKDKCDRTTMECKRFVRKKHREVENQGMYDNDMEDNDIDTCQYILNPIF